MAKADWKPGNLLAFQQRVSKLPPAVRLEGEQATIEVAALAAEEMRDVIENSGTGWEGRKGRVASGDMLRAVASEGNRFGWLAGYRDYFGLQNRGFVNLRKNAKNEGITWITGTGGPPGTTEGMQALETARLVGRGQMYNRAKRLLSKAWRSVR